MFCSSIKKAIWNFMAYAHLFYEFKPENFYNENIVSNLILCIIYYHCTFIYSWRTIKNIFKGQRNQTKQLFFISVFDLKVLSQWGLLFCVETHYHRENFGPVAPLKSKSRKSGATAYIVYE